MQLQITNNQALIFNKLIFIILLALLSFIFTSCKTDIDIDKNPNLVYILADDLGYGDISAYNAASKIITPNIDILASEGLVFTDAHSGSAVCTPTRYGILTGRYSWRTRLKSGVTWSWDKPIIDSTRINIASMLKEKGYSTACIGKWHLGLGWVMDDEKGIADFTKPLTSGPNNLGFDYSYIIAASLDIPPYVYIEDHHITAQPNRITSDDSKFGWWREGNTGADFEHEDVLPTLVEKAVNWINECSEANDPFFLYLALPAPHTPILPTKEFTGISNTNPYGDFVVMVDHMVGKVTEALERNNLYENTIIVFTSDNGCSPQADFEQLDSLGHSPSYIYRGHKADIFEGGHRIPFIIRWPEMIKAGRKIISPVSLNDIMATMADITDYDLPADAAEDSYSLQPVFTGNTDQFKRESVVHHSVSGHFAIRKGKYKLNLCAGSGGWSSPTEKEAKEMGLPEMQLYNIDEDPGERNNLINELPEKAKELEELLMKQIKEGRSTPGPIQENTASEGWPANKLTGISISHDSIQ